jgi:hypothetical protein
VSAKLLTISPEPAVPADVIEHLTTVCGWVEKDDVSAVGIAVVHRDGSTSTVWSTPPNKATLIGAVARLQHRLVTSENP